MNLDHDATSDAELLAAHVDGDPDAFGLLVTRHRDRLWAVALRTTGHPEDAADALQDALVSAYRQAATFRGDSAVTTWLHRVVVNACLDRLRRNRVRAASPLPDDLDDHAARGHLATGPDGPGVGEDPQHAVLASEVRDRVRGALARIPHDQAAALALVDLEGLTVAEAAGVLGVPTGTVKSRCSRGRARLAVLLADLV
ncbi:MAG: polymerase, sigma subunit, family, partial [Marmoricola sp.]|nr:polymerase, sigma subunit, family [Marmoricola sp.]